MRRSDLDRFEIEFIRALRDAHQDRVARGLVW